MESSTAVLMIKTLDCLVARQIATAENIANANTPNYRPLRVTFEKALADAAAQGDAAVRGVMPTVERIPAGSVDAELRLDLEMSTASGTTGRYGAIVDVLNRQLQLQSLAITGSN